MKMNAMRAALVVLVLLSASLPVDVHAAPIPANPICAGFSAAGINFGLINPNDVIPSNASGGAQTMLMIALLIILLMFALAGILYGIGYAFRIDKLVRFSRAEIGEAVISVLIVLILIGTFYIGTQSIGPQNLFALGKGSFNTNLFVADCSLLAQNSFDLVPVVIGTGLNAEVLDIMASFKINVAPYNFGFEYKPFDGLVALTQVLYTLTYTTTGLIAITLGSAIFLSIIYSLFPLFLYAGIVLRTLPWTRAAGGAFIGMFIAFYIVFPMLIFVMTTGYLPYANRPGLLFANNPVTAGSYDQITATCFSGTPNNCQLFVGSTQVASGSGSASYPYFASAAGCFNIQAYDNGNGETTTQVLQVNPASSASASPCASSSYSQLAGVVSSAGGTGSFSATQFTTPFSNINTNPYANPSGASPGLIQGYITNVLQQVVYTVFSVVLALLISFDFMEALGDLLGAPALSSSDVLRRIL